MTRDEVLEVLERAMTRMRATAGASAEAEGVRSVEGSQAVLVEGHQAVLAFAGTDLPAPDLLGMLDSRAAQAMKDIMLAGPHGTELMRGVILEVFVFGLEAGLEVARRQAAEAVAG